MKKLAICALISFTYISTCYSQSPMLHWANCFGDGFTETDINSSTDRWGNVYTVGGTGEVGAGNLSDFDPDPNTVCQFPTFFPTLENFFVSKYDSSGNFIWTRYYGGASMDHPYAMTTDRDGNIYLVGRGSASIMMWPDSIHPVLQLTNNMNGGFVMKLDSSGQLVWGTDCLIPIQTNNSQEVISISVSGQHEVFVGSQNGLIRKYDSTGVLQWTIQVPWNISTNMGMFMTSLAVSSSGEVYCAGDGTDTLTGQAFYGVAKIDDMSGVAIWIRTFYSIGGTSSLSGGLSVQCDADRSVCVMGNFTGTIDFDPGAPGQHVLTSTNSPSYVGFLLKLDTAGHFQWVRSFNGYSAIMFSGGTGNSLSIASDGEVSMMYYFSDSVDADPDPNASYFLGCGGGYAIVRLDSAGDFEWAFCIGGACDGNSISIQNDGDRATIVTGVFCGSPDFDPGPGYDTTCVGGGSCFVLRIHDDMNTRVDMEPYYHLPSLEVYPTPASASVSIRYSTGSNELTTITVLDGVGRTVKELCNDVASPGSHQIYWELDDVNSRLSNGIYYIRLTCGEYTQTKRMVVI